MKEISDQISIQDVDMWKHFKIDLMYSLVPSNLVMIIMRCVCSAGLAMTWQEGKRLGVGHRGQPGL